jgi:hypothetical protein
LTGTNVEASQPLEEVEVLALTVHDEEILCAMERPLQSVFQEMWA